MGKPVIIVAGYPAQSLCVCGHRGDAAPNRDGNGQAQMQHDVKGICVVRGCPCRSFIWKRDLTDQEKSR